MNSAHLLKEEMGETAFDGVTTLMSYIKCQKLNEDEFASLFKTMFHESMHSTDPWWRVMADGWKQPAKF